MKIHDLLQNGSYIIIRNPTTKVQDNLRKLIETALQLKTKEDSLSSSLRGLPKYKNVADDERYRNTDNNDNVPVISRL